MNKIKWWGMAILFLFVFGISLNSGVLDAKENKIRVGMFSLGKFQGWDEKGNVEGYNIEYLNEIAKKTHWEYEYVDCKNWVEATELLEQGKIDLLAPAQNIKALSEKFSYTALAMGNESAAIYTKTDRSDLLYEDFSKMNTLTYGCAEGSTFALKFETEYSKDHQMDPSIKYYANTTEQQKALANGEVDAIVTNIMFNCPEYKLLGWFSPLPVYYISQKNNYKLLNKLDEAMIEITIEKPTFQADLLSRHFPIYDSTNITYDENQYLKSLPELKVGYITNEKPIAYTDSNGQFVGISREIADRIAKNLGLKFQYVALEKDDIDYKNLRRRGIYLIANYECDMGNEVSANVRVSQPYLNLEQIFVTNQEENMSSESKSTIVVDAMTARMTSSIHKKYPRAVIMVKPTITDCFEALERGSADYLLGKRYVIKPYLNRPSYESMQVLQDGFADSECCFAVLKYEENGTALSKQLNNDYLISALDKGINQISEDKINAIVFKQTVENVYQYTIFDFTYQYRFFLIALTVAAILIVTLVTLVYQNKKKHMLLIENKNAQLAEAMEQANKANASKSRFLAQISHEIRTPMNVIMGLSSIARVEVENPTKMREILGKIDSSSRLLLGIINDVLDMSAIENHKMKLAKAEFDFKQLLTDISSVFYQECKEKNQSFKVEVNGVIQEQLIGDALRLKQILINILSNAVKFTPSGGKISLQIVQASQSLYMVHLRFVISDTGCGMSNELKARLFQPFEQENAVTAEKYGGSGLGLAITKNLVELMNGTISYTSEVNHGTTFMVDIPFEKAEDQCVKIHREFENICVLLVDNQPDSSDYVEKVFERLRVKCHVASNSDECLKELSKAEEEGRPYSFCLIEWKMNQDNLIRKIRNVFASDIPIVVMSYDVDEISEDASKIGADLVIAKPLFQSTIFNILMEIAHGHFQNRTQTGLGDEYHLAGHKVLLAEDVPLNMEVAASFLEMAKMEVVQAEDGEEAVQLFMQSSENEFDAILMDINMPKLSGYEATKQIRESGRADAKTVLIYAMTANAFTEDVTRALDAGMNGHIAKPIETQILYQTLQDGFDQKKNGGANESI